MNKRSNKQRIESRYEEVNDDEFIRAKNEYEKNFKEKYYNVNDNNEEFNKYVLESSLDFKSKISNDNHQKEIFNSVDRQYKTGSVSNRIHYEVDYDENMCKSQFKDMFIQEEPVKNKKWISKYQKVQL